MSSVNAHLVCCLRKGLNEKCRVVWNKFLYPDEATWRSLWPYHTSLAIYSISTRSVFRQMMTGDLNIFSFGLSGKQYLWETFVRILVDRCCFSSLKGLSRFIYWWKYTPNCPEYAEKCDRAWLEPSSITSGNPFKYRENLWYIIK